MPQYIIKLEGRYLIWSTIVDAPITFGMTARELDSFIRAEYGERGMHELRARLKRVEETGTSCIDQTLDEIIDFNRAGPNETCLSKEQIVDKYVRRKRLTL